MAKSVRIPERMCILCRRMMPKRELLRIVSDGDTLKVDLTGKANGRGAYICTDEACLAKIKSAKVVRKVFGGKADEAFLQSLTAGVEMLAQNGHHEKEVSVAQSDTQGDCGQQ